MLTLIRDADKPAAQPQQNGFEDEESEDAARRGANVFKRNTELQKLKARLIKYNKHTKTKAKR